MSELPKIYNPKDFEQKWFSFWEKKGYFNASPNNKIEPFTIVIPPPNITSHLHMGHGLNNTIQDILIRWKRMQGYNTLWMPGTDHAGIATQNVVEKELSAKNKSRHDYTREDFIKEVWKWKEQYGSIIINQLKAMGCSCDWDRERFTMDPGLSKAVREVFVRLYEDGLIYKGKYIVNWCPRCGTALSNEEVDYESISGFFYHIKYMIKNSDKYIEIATTRPETMLGDTAVAVNPNDNRYKHLIGKTLILPLVNREIPIIADRHSKMDFGTGAVKVTPAHDPNDFLIAKRHNLKQINIMNPNGTMSEDAGNNYKGLDRFECRKKVVNDLINQGLFIKKIDHIHNVGHCYRCSTMVEPYLSDQWFVKMKPLAKKAKEVVENNEIRFYPSKHKKVYIHWMDNIEDWCISRQIWWGHRIPVWTCTNCNEIIVTREDPNSCPKCNCPLEQDNDVLDTWFSSMLWPFSTMGWPDKTKELSYFYPTNVLSTAPEILFFWVARMIMAGLYFMDDIPYSEVYLHSTVRDKLGRKMSKSLGNGIDPLKVINKHGADALRFTITSLSPMGLDIKLSFSDKENDFLVGTRFANKIWNASRYILMNIKNYSINPIDKDCLSLADKWILTSLNNVILKSDNYLSSYRFNDFAMALYDFIWHDFCDWYIELSKIKLYGESVKEKENSLSILVYVLSESLKLLHPIMPFITEEVWQKLSHDGDSIMVSSYPKVNSEYSYNTAEKNMAIIKEIVYSIRNIRGEMNIPPDKRVNIVVKATDNNVITLLNNHSEYINSLAKLESMSIRDEFSMDSGCAYSIGSGYELYIPLKGVIDIDKEKDRTVKEINKLEKELTRTNKKLQNNDFINKAKDIVIQKEKDKLKEFSINLDKLRDNLSLLG